MSDSQLIVYGVPLSQPVRAVMWLLLMKRQPFELVLINPGSSGDNGSRNPAFLEKNPGGTIPTIEEPDTGFTLGEAHAIMAYLCRKHGWDDLYPADDQARAKVDWYLNFHHRNVREASIGQVAPMFRKDLQFPEDMLKTSARALKGALTALDNWWLKDSAFLVGDSVTIADLAAYVEIGQLRAEFTNVYDLSPYPNVMRWLNAMMEVDGHDDVHVVLKEIGDLSQESPSIDVIKNANKSALVALKTRLAEFQ